MTMPILRVPVLWFTWYTLSGRDVVGETDVGETSMSSSKSFQPAFLMWDGVIGMRGTLWRFQFGRETAAGGLGEESLIVIPTMMVVTVIAFSIKNKCENERDENNGIGYRYG